LSKRHNSSESLSPNIVVKKCKKNSLRRVDKKLKYTQLTNFFNRDQIKQIFKVIDEDGSGSLTKEEFVEAAKSEEVNKRLAEFIKLKK